MHRTTRPLRALRKPTTIQPCRVVTGRRCSLPPRAFHTSPKTRSTPHDPLKPSTDGPAQPPELSSDPSAEKSDPQRKDASASSPQRPESYTSPLNDGTLDSEAPKEGLQNVNVLKTREHSPYGSAIKRATRGSRKARDSPTLNLPYWFIERNVQLREDVQNGVSVTKSIKGDTNEAFEVQGGTTKTTKTQDSVKPDPHASTYVLNEVIYEEIRAFSSASLNSVVEENGSAQLPGKQHLLLQSPKAGGMTFLGGVVRRLAVDHDADIISIDAQDIAEIASDPALELPSRYADSVRALGYETHIVEHANQSQNSDNTDAFDPFQDEGEDDTLNNRNFKPFILPMPKAKKDSTQVKNVHIPIQDILKSVKSIAPTLFNQQGPPMMVMSEAPGESPQPLERLTGDGRVSAVVEAFLNAAKVKAYLKDPDQRKKYDLSLTAHVPVVNGNQNLEKRQAPIIVRVKDYLELCSTTSGSRVISLLHRIVDQKRAEGVQMIIVGNSSSEDLMPPLTREGFANTQMDFDQPYQAVIVPCANHNADQMFRKDEMSRIYRINSRNMRHMIRQSTPRPTTSTATEFVSSSSHLNVADRPRIDWRLDLKVLPYEQVQRMAATALGTYLKEAKDDSAIKFQDTHVTRALEILWNSDKAKLEWLGENQEKRKSSSRAGPATTDPQKSHDERVKQLGNLNKYEKRLTNGIVEPHSIRTTFKDVLVPAQTIQALKTLTTLSLIRPDAFSYGVLATDKIPGLLLYGPPGTGKTMLAKAVAKESGATVLDVAGSDLYDKWVGEAEKNVRAVFSLAKKLSPCVVFIDEADAIFGSRSGPNRNSHRELINQFLREWDGMKMSAFIMVATNRPFDLDDAVLRRLARRLLVDLPTEGDREKILRLHLKEETLASSASLSDLAARTPFYSGSDLKNLSVAAALACVREEVEAEDQANRATESGADLHEEKKAPAEPTLARSTESLPNGTPMRAPERPEKPQDASNEADMPTVMENQTAEQSPTGSPVINAADELHGKTSDHDVQSIRKPESEPKRKKRVLTRAHFEKGLEEISASISDDMSSLAAIRKFDEKYGDRKGRRKKLGAYGFGAMSEGDREREKAESGRVRSLEIPA